MGYLRWLLGYDLHFGGVRQWVDFVIVPSGTSSVKQNGCITGGTRPQSKKPLLLVIQKRIEHKAVAMGRGER